MLQETNPAPEQSNAFYWPDVLAPTGVRTLSFDVDADPVNWVITSVNGGFVGLLQQGHRRFRLDTSWFQSDIFPVG